MLYAVGDIHGEIDALERLLARLPLRPDDRFVFLGDYIDRGPDARGVVDRLIDLSNAHECTFLLGNHESMFLDFIGWQAPQYFGGDAFLSNGGARTLASYGYFDDDDPQPERMQLPKSHVRFYENLKMHHTEGDYVFVHAGLATEDLLSGDLRYVLRRSRPQDLLWNRSHIGQPNTLGATIVYGHTPNPDFAVHWHAPYSIGIDTGATFGGWLTALRLPDETLFQA